jgi:hypothetical protein
MSSQMSKQKDAPQELTVCKPAPACTWRDAQHDINELTWQVSKQSSCGVDGRLSNSSVVCTLNIIVDLNFNYSLGSRDGNILVCSSFIGFHGRNAH